MPTGVERMVTQWADDEWTPLSVHVQLGSAAGAAYTACRTSGADDYGAVVLGMAQELLAFDFGETFTDAFEVSNKVVEMLMLRDGVDVCCTSAEDKQRVTHG